MLRVGTTSILTHRSGTSTDMSGRRQRSYASNSLRDVAAAAVVSYPSRRCECAWQCEAPGRRRRLQRA